MHPEFTGGIHEKKDLNRNDNGLFRGIVMEKELKVFVSHLVELYHGCTSGCIAMTNPILTGIWINQRVPLHVHSERAGRLRKSLN